MKKVGILVIGCDYNNTQYSLDGCINDAIDIGQTLVDICAKKKITPDIKVLLDNDNTNFPSKENIRFSLTQLVNKANNGVYNSIVVYFAGHGFQQKDNNNDESDGEDELIMTGDLKFYTDDELKYLFVNIRPSVSTTLIFDCCHSGSMMDLPKITLGVKRNKPKSGRNINNLYNKQKIICISACDDSQKSVEENGRGLFTQRFCSRLRNNNNISILNLVSSLSSRLASENMTLTLSSTKNVQVGGSSIFFIRSKGKNKRGIDIVGEKKDKKKCKKNCYDQIYGKKIDKSPKRIIIGDRLCLKCKD